MCSNLVLQRIDNQFSSFENYIIVKLLNNKKIFVVIMPTKTLIFHTTKETTALSYDRSTICR